MTTAAREDDGAPLAAPLATLKGVGASRAAALARLGLETVGDLLLYLPRRLEASGSRVPLASARGALGERVVVEGVVVRRSFSRFGRRSTLRLGIQDDDGEELEVLYYNQPWQRHAFERGARVQFAGRVSETPRGPALVAPRFAAAEPGLVADALTPLYPVTEGLGQELLRRLVARALEVAGDALAEPLAADELARLDALSLAEAVRELHAPREVERFARARRRVLLETLLPLEARVLAGGRAARAELAARSVPRDEGLRARFEASLAFRLTAGQRAVLDEVEADLASGRAMRRLLQGDVGAGKTVLGLYAALAVARAGGQAAFMAPTELLAEQHHAGLAPLCAELGLSCGLLTGSTRGAARRALTRDLAVGTVDLVFGTHALLSRDVRFARLDLAIIDEQQRFGVAQRARLVEKGAAAHLLLMTATPIPRTLAHTLYGDLDVSVLREKPPGRGPLTTRWLRKRDRERLPEFLRERLAAGEQVYWVSPLVGEEEGEERGALRAHRRLAKSALAPFGLELVHGRLPSDERAARLERFRRGEARLLVATTVIEVGVDVPAATVLVVEDAERLGLAQLHQLRGRVGRGPRASYCLLYGRPGARARLELLERCDDGFAIAEEDLKLRGMGELAGTRQAGVFGGVLADLAGDLDLLVAARELLSGRPELLRAYARGAAAALPTP